jgi:FkbM family methyltransferase
MFKQLQINALADHPDFAESSVANCFSKQPLGYIDIGARGGAHDIVFGIARHTAVLGFEPDNEECCRLLADMEIKKPWSSFELEAVALSRAEEEVTLHLLSDPNNHSLLPPNDKFLSRYNMQKWVEIGSKKINAVTLDSILFGKRRYETHWGEFIKLDTQGTEFNILEGSSRVLRERCVAAVIEVSFCELYKDQKLFSDVEKIMREHGFSFYGFMPIHSRSCKLLNKHMHITAERALYSDAIFFKDPLDGRKDVKLSIRQNYALFTIAVLLNFYDFALELARKTWLKDVSAQEKLLVESLINKLSEYPVIQSIKDAEELAKQVVNRPDLANYFIGNFVDRRRKVCNFDDVLNISPLPRML